MSENEVNPTADKLLTVSEVAETLRLVPQTIYRMARRGELPSLKFGRTIRFDRQDIEEFLKGNNR